MRAMAPRFVITIPAPPLQYHRRPQLHRLGGLASPPLAVARFATTLLLLLAAAASLQLGSASSSTSTSESTAAAVGARYRMRFEEEYLCTGVVTDTPPHMRLKCRRAPPRVADCACSERGALGTQLACRCAPPRNATGAVVPLAPRMGVIEGDGDE